MVNSPSQSGFSLLEAIVALAIMSGIAVAAFSWLNTALLNTERTNQNYEAQQVAENFLAEIKPSDLIKNQSGRSDYGSYSVSWTAKPIDKANGLLTNGVPSQFALALFQVDLEVQKGEELVATFQVRKAAFRKGELSETGGRE